MLILEFVADFILEQKIGRSRFFGSIWVLWFGDAFALLRSFAILRQKRSFAFSFT